MFLLIHSLSAVCVCLTCVSTLLEGSFGEQRLNFEAVQYIDISFYQSFFLMSNQKTLCFTVDPIFYF